MYSIYSTIGGYTVCLHDDLVSDPRVKVIDPTLSLEDNSAGSLTFKLAPNNAGYNRYDLTEYVSDPEATGEEVLIPITRSVDLVERMAATVTVYRTNQNGLKQEIWEGRVLSENNDFDNLREIYCEGELAYLNDTIQPQREFAMVTLRQFVEAIFNTHNGKVEDAKKFYVGSFTVDVGSIESRKTDYGSTWDAISSVIDEYKCHVRVRKSGGLRYVDFFADYPTTSSQLIRLGSNLLDFTRSWDMANLATAVLPTGAVTQSATSSSVGEPITATTGVPRRVSITSNKILYVDENDGNTVKIKNTNINSYRVAEYVLTADTNYYVSSRLHGGYVAYVIYTSGGLQHSYKTSGRSGENGFDDLVDNKITMPTSEVGNTYTLKVCSWGKDISPTVKVEIPPTTDFDKYLTVENAQTTSSSSGFVLLLSEPDDWKQNWKDYYVHTQGAGYTHVGGSSAPEWESNTYYQYIQWHTKGSPYVINRPAVTKYGWIEKHLEFKDIQDENQLLTAAINYLKSGQFDEMTIDISAIDLGAIGVEASAINLLDMVRVVSDPHGMDRWFPVTKLEIPLNDPAEQRFTLGYTSSGETISAANAEAVSTIKDKIAAIPSMSSILESAQQNAEQLINSDQGGYVTFRKDNDGNIIEILISNALDYTTATKVWRWNQNGFGYSSNGWQGPFSTAITMDGTILGNFIAARSIAGEALYGTTIKVGGANNQNGLLQVINDNDAIICQFDDTGGNINGTMRTTETSGGDTFFSMLTTGKLIAGKVVSGADQEWGRFDGRVKINLDGREYHGLSLEANRSGTSVSDGVISLCAGRIVLAPNTATRIEAMCIQNATIPVGQKISIENEDTYTQVRSQSSPPTFESGKYYSKSGNTYTALSNQPTNWETTYTSYYTKSTTRKLVLKGRDLTYMNGFLVGVGDEETLSSVSLPSS